MFGQQYQFLRSDASNIRGQICGAKFIRIQFALFFDLNGWL